MSFFRIKETKNELPKMTSSKQVDTSFDHQRMNTFYFTIISLILNGIHLLNASFYNPLKSFEQFIPFKPKENTKPYGLLPFIPYIDYAQVHMGCPYINLYRSFVGCFSYFPRPNCDCS